MSDLREVLRTYSHADGKYEPLSDGDLENLRLEVNKMIQEMNIDSMDTYLEILSELIVFAIVHFDTITIIQENTLNSIPYELIMAIASLMILDSGYFGKSAILEIFFTPKEGRENERIALWDRFKVPDIKEKIYTFLGRDDFPEEFRQEILTSLNNVEKI